MPPRTVKSKIEEPVGESDRFSFFKATRRIMLAAIGAAALAQDELEAYVNRLVERGELAERDGRKIMEELLERRKKKREQFMQNSSQRLTSLMQGMNIPTKDDIEKLNERLNSLSQKIESLKRE